MNDIYTKGDRLAKDYLKDKLHTTAWLADHYKRDVEQSFLAGYLQGREDQLQEARVMIAMEDSKKKPE